MIMETNEIVPEKVKLTVRKANLPSNTVPGKRTIVLPVSNTGRPIDSTNYAVLKYFGDANEPLVILLAEQKFIPTVHTNLNKLKRKVITYQLCGTEPSSEESREGVKNYLKNPSGILLTEAEAFNGMQARNILIIGGSSANVRNFIMRGISFVVFIQKEKHINTFINQEQSGNLQD